MGDFAAPKLDKIKIAIIGVGARGSGHATQLGVIEGTEIVAICDLYEDRAKRSEQRVTAKGHTPKIYFGDENAWRKMLTEVKPDTVFIATPWETHAPMGVAAMKAGAHAFIEMPIAVTLEEMWEMVDTSEDTGRHCMLMENVNYGREELVYLNMVRQGVIGELLHGEAAYIHELRGQMKEVERGTGSWRTYQYAKRNGNLYPCHGLGPVAQYMSLARTEDTFGRLVSFSSPAKGRTLYAKAKFPADHKWNKQTFTGRRHQHVDHQDRARPHDHGPVGRNLPRPVLAPQPDPGHQGHPRRLPEPPGHRGRDQGPTSGPRARSWRSWPRNTSTRSSSAWANWRRRWAATAAWTS